MPIFGLMEPIWMRRMSPKGIRDCFASVSALDSLKSVRHFQKVTEKSVTFHRTTIYSGVSAGL